MREEERRTKGIVKSHKMAKGAGRDDENGIK